MITIDLAIAGIFMQTFLSTDKKINTDKSKSFVLSLNIFRLLALTNFVNEQPKTTPKVENKYCVQFLQTSNSFQQQQRRR